MVNPYQSPAEGYIQPDFDRVRRKLLIGSVCLHLIAAVGIVIGGWMAYDWLTTPADRDVHSALHPFIPFVVPIAFLLAALCELAVWGIRRRKDWSIVLGITILAVNAFSLSFPVCAIGIWALADASIKKYFKDVRRNHS